MHQTPVPWRQVVALLGKAQVEKAHQP